jgi:hypothetical protein
MSKRFWLEEVRTQELQDAATKIRQRLKIRTTEGFKE